MKCIFNSRTPMYCRNCGSMLSHSCEQRQPYMFNPYNGNARYHLIEECPNSRWWNACAGERLIPETEHSHN